MVRPALKATAFLALLVSAAACGKAPKSREGYVWDPERECWEPRRLDHPVRYVWDQYVLYTVDEDGTCWRIPGTGLPPREWGPPPVSTAEACGDARYSDETCEDTGA